MTNFKYQWNYCNLNISCSTANTVTIRNGCEIFFKKGKNIFKREIGLFYFKLENEKSFRFLYKNTFAIDFQHLNIETDCFTIETDKENELIVKEINELSQSALEFITSNQETVIFKIKQGSKIKLVLKGNLNLLSYFKPKQIGTIHPAVNTSLLSEE